MSLADKISGLVKRKFHFGSRENWIDSWEDGEGPKLTTLQEFREFFEHFSEYWKGEEEKKFTLQCKESETGSTGIPGYCQVCGKESPFTLTFNCSDGTYPNFRESMYCPFCGLNSRQRKMVSVLKRWCENRGGNCSIYMYERLTKAFEAVASFSPGVVGSEYLAGNLESGEMVDGILHEDAQHLSFADESFDILVSSDVFEHVNDYRSCFKEAFRVLKKGGCMYLSVPFYLDKGKSFRRCGFVDGELKFYAPEQYHVNPISNEGSLVFWDYGWDMLQDLRAAGFAEVYMQPYYSRTFGYMGELQYYFVAEKA